MWAGGFWVLLQNVAFLVLVSRNRPFRILCSAECLQNPHKLCVCLCVWCIHGVLEPLLFIFVCLPLTVPVLVVRNLNLPLDPPLCEASRAVEKVLLLSW